MLRTSVDFAVFFSVKLSLKALPEVIEPVIQQAIAEAQSRGIAGKRLTPFLLEKIVEIEIRGVSARLKDRDIEVELTPEALTLLIEKGFDPVFGARPLKRTIQRYLEDPLAEEILRGNIHEGEPVQVTVEGDKLAFIQTAAAGALSRTVKALCVPKVCSRIP